MTKFIGDGTTIMTMTGNHIAVQGILKGSSILIVCGHMAGTIVGGTILRATGQPDILIKQQLVDVNGWYLMAPGKLGNYLVECAHG